MSILKNTTTTTLSDEQIRAKRVISSTKQAAKQLVRSWETGWDAIWNATDPQLVLDELGTDAVEVFELSDVTITMIITLLTDRDEVEKARLLAKIAAKPATTSNPDGTVTID